MRVPRIYHPFDEKTASATWQVEQHLELHDDAANHVGRVLRMNTGQALTLFNGDGFDYAATIVAVTKKQVTVVVTERTENRSEAPIKIHLGQGVSRGDRMDFVLQKSVELGVHAITPLFTERCGVKLSGDRLLKKQQQWQKIVIAACEQSGRSYVPTVHSPLSLSQWLADLPPALRLTLDPEAQVPLREQQLTGEHIQLLIGPEGGLTDAEIAAGAAADFQPVRLGPRVLRTETAALSALTAVQYQFGDLAMATGKE